MEICVYIHPLFIIEKTTPASILCRCQKINFNDSKSGIIQSVDVMEFHLSFFSLTKWKTRKFHHISFVFWVVRRKYSLDFASSVISPPKKLRRGCECKVENSLFLRNLVHFSSHNSFLSESFSLFPSPASPKSSKIPPDSPLPPLFDFGRPLSWNFSHEIFRFFSSHSRESKKKEN